MKNFTKKSRSFSRLEISGNFLHVNKEGIDLVARSTLTNASSYGLVNWWWKLGKRGEYLDEVPLIFVDPFNKFRTYKKRNVSLLGILENKQLPNQDWLKLGLMGVGFYYYKAKAACKTKMNRGVSYFTSSTFFRQPSGPSCCWNHTLKERQCVFMTIKFKLPCQIS